MNKYETLNILNKKEGIVKVLEKVTGETAEGEVKDIMKWVCDISDTGEVNFRIIEKAEHIGDDLIGK